MPGFEYYWSSNFSLPLKSLRLTAKRLCPMRCAREGQPFTGKAINSSSKLCSAAASANRSGRGLHFSLTSSVRSTLTSPLLLFCYQHGVGGHSGGTALVFFVFCDQERLNSTRDQTEYVDDTEVGGRKSSSHSSHERTNCWRCWYPPEHVANAFFCGRLGPCVYSPVCQYKGIKKFFMMRMAAPAQLSIYLPLWGDTGVGTTRRDGISRNLPRCSLVHCLLPVSVGTLDCLRTSVSHK